MFDKLATVCKQISLLLLVSIQAIFAAIGLYIDVGGVHGLRTDFAYDFAYSTEKVTQSELLGYNKTFTMHLAKNEREACQIVLRNRYTGIKKVSLTVGEFKNSDGVILPAQVFEVRYILGGKTVIEYQNFPDALVPYSGGQIGLQKQINQPFYIEVRSTKDTPAGVYTATITLNDLEKETVAFETTVTAEVWDFALPEEPACETSMGIFGSQFYALNGITASTGHQSSQTGNTEADLLYKQYYDFLLDHKVSAYSLPYDIMDPRADAYMSDPRVTSFIIPHSADDQALQSYYQKVSGNPIWKSKAYFYPIDEPSNEEQYSSYIAITDRLARLCPGYNMATPFFINDIAMGGSQSSSVELQKGRSNILCPITDLYDTKGFKESIKASGSRSWWYVCCGPTGDYCNLHMTNEGLRHRILFWQQKSHDVQGLLYWDTVYWDKCDNPWYNAQTWDANSYGDGSLMYPGKTIGIDSPVASVRLKGVTNGIEDFEYFTMAEQLLGRDYVNKVIAKVTKSLTNYTKNDKTFDNIRIELGNAIAAATVQA